MQCTILEMVDSTNAEALEQVAEVARAEDTAPAGAVSSPCEGRRGGWRDFDSRRRACRARRWAPESPDPIPTPVSSRVRAPSTHSFGLVLCALDLD